MIRANRLDDIVASASLVQRVLRPGLPLLATLLVGCLPSMSPKPAASSLHCPEDKVSLEGDSPYYRVAHGCGKTDVIVRDADGYKFSTLRDRARFELSCSDGDIDVTVLEPETFGATGCGKKVVYKWIVQVGLVANTAQEPGGVAPEK